MDALAKALKGDAPYVVGEKFQTSCGVINYVVEGEKVYNRPLVVCLHGLNASLSQFTLLAKILTSLGYRVLRMDLFGHGLSSELKPRPRTQQQFLAKLLQTVYDLIQHVEGEVLPLNLIGFSMGGCLAVEFRNAFPTIVRKLVLLSPAGLIGRRPKVLRLVEAPVIGVLLRGLIYFLYTILTFFCIRNSKMKEFYSASEYLDVKQESLDPNATKWRSISRRNLRSALLYAKMMHMWTNEDMYRVLAANPIPVLFCWGALDELTPYTECEQLLRELLPDAEWHVYPDCRHVILEEEQNELYRTIYRFVRDGDSGTERSSLVDSPVRAPLCGDSSVASPQTDLLDLTPRQPFLLKDSLRQSYSTAVDESETAATQSSVPPSEQIMLQLTPEPSSMSYVQERIKQFELAAPNAPLRHASVSAPQFELSPALSEITITDTDIHLEAVMRRATVTKFSPRSSPQSNHGSNFAVVNYMMAARRSAR